MAIRLGVVMVHSPPALPGAAQLAESVVGELIGMPEIDLTLVGPLATLSGDSTDLLTLHALEGDAAVLDWVSPDALATELERQGIRGQRAPHSNDPVADAPAAGQRRLYLFDLTQFDRAQAVCQALTQLKSSRQVRTFSLGAIGSAPAESPTVSAESPTGSAESPTAPAESPIASAELPTARAVGVPLPAESKPSPTRNAGSASGNDRPESLDLDDLLNQLDELDP